MSITMFWLQVFLYISLGLVVLFVIQEFLNSVRWEEHIVVYKQKVSCFRVPRRLCYTIA